MSFSRCAASGLTGAENRGGERRRRSKLPEYSRDDRGYRGYASPTA